MKQYDTITVYDTMTVAELKTLAKEIGVKLVSGMKKQDIIDALKEAEQNGQTEKKETENAADASEDRKTTSTSEKQNIQKKKEFLRIPMVVFHFSCCFLYSFSSRVFSPRVFSSLCPRT